MKILTLTPFFLHLLTAIFDTESLLRDGGLLIIFLMVYGQSGVFFAFFLPSGALLFTTGVWVATGEFHYSAAVVCCMLTLAAMLGNITGYWFGRKAGPLLYSRKDSALFKREHLIAAHDFYRKYGGLALAAGPFFPVIRTFSPIVAGMIRLNFRRFLFFSAIGSALWIISFVMSGYLLGIIPALKPYLRYVVIGIIVTVTVPIVIRVVKEFNRAGKKPPARLRQKESDVPDHLR